MEFVVRSLPHAQWDGIGRGGGGEVSRPTSGARDGNRESQRLFDRDRFDFFKCGMALQDFVNAVLNKCCHSLF
jgi:hypothetical protein